MKRWGFYEGKKKVAKAEKGAPRAVCTLCAYVTIWQVKIQRFIIYAKMEQKDEK